MWKCPVCGREFSVKKQWHSCNVLDLESHFEGKPAWEREVFERIENILSCEDLKIIPVKTSILFRKKSNILSLVLFKNKIRLEYASFGKAMARNIKRSVKISSNRYYNSIEIYGKEDLTEELESDLSRLILA